MISTLGDADAQNRLGFLYESGKGATADYAQAVNWYRKAASRRPDDWVQVGESRRAARETFACASPLLDVCAAWRGSAGRSSAWKAVSPPLWMRRPFFKRR